MQLLDPDLAVFPRRSYLQNICPQVLATVMRPASLQGAVMTWNRAEDLSGLTVHDTVFATIEFEGGFARMTKVAPRRASARGTPSTAA
jgi:hypothetical protein